MSDAKVEFDDDTFGFACPKHKGRRCEGLHVAGRTNLPRDGENKNGGVAQWTLEGPESAPTFHPSINCEGCWHGNIRNGRCVDTSGNEEPEPT